MQEIQKGSTIILMKVLKRTEYSILVPYMLWVLPRVDHNSALFKCELSSDIMGYAN